MSRHRVNFKEDNMDTLRLRARCARRGWPVTKIQHKTIAIVACKKEVKNELGSNKGRAPANTACR
jgi:hypothetical protein